MMINSQVLREAFNDDFWDKVPEVKPDKLSFIGSVIKSSENRLQALLSYCLNPNNGHEIHGVFLDALLSCLEDSGRELSLGFIDDMDGYEVITEFFTDNGGRIDILIKSLDLRKTLRRALIIELKLDSHLHNDLADYYQSVKDCNDNNKVGIVLGLNTIDTASIIAPFYFISLQDYFKKIKQFRDRYFPKKAEQDEHINFFFEDFFNYTEKIHRNFLSNCIGSHLSFLFENSEKSLLLKSALQEIDEREAIRLFYSKNEAKIDLFNASVHFVVKSLNDFAKDWLKVSDRDGQVREEGLLYFRFSKNQPFHRVFRFAYDFTDCLVFKPQVRLKLEIYEKADFDSLFAIDVNSVIEMFKRQQFTGSNKASYTARSQWVEVFNTVIDDKDRIVDYYDMFHDLIIPRVNELEEFIISKLIFRYQSKFSNYIINNALAREFAKDKHLGGQINEGNCLHKQFEDVFFTFKWTGHNIVSVSLWSTSETDDLLDSPSIREIVDSQSWTLHDSEDDSFTDININEVGMPKDVYKNFTLRISLDDISSSEQKISNKLKQIYSIMAQMKRHEIE